MGLFIGSQAHFRSSVLSPYFIVCHISKITVILLLCHICTKNAWVKSGLQIHLKIPTSLAITDFKRIVESVAVADEKYFYHSLKFLIKVVFTGFPDVFM